MDWQQAIREERTALMSIVDLLMVLANLAELAGGRSPVVRGLVLWLLRHAEAVARDFVAGSSPVHGGSELRPREARWRGRSRSIDDCPDARPVEAMRLAMSLRALARQLAEQANLMLAMRGEGGAGTQPPPSAAMQVLHRVSNALRILSAFVGPSPHPAPDTS